jgi:hypothetical protein
MKLVRDYLDEIESTIENVDWNTYINEEEKKNKLADIIKDIIGFEKNSLESIYIVNAFYDYYFNKK